MRTRERIPLHDHSNDDAGGIVATTRARLIAQSASSTPGDIGGGSSGGGSGSSGSDELTLQLSDDSTADFEIDWSKDVTDVTLTANVTYTYANVPATGTPAVHLLIRRMGTGGPFTETFPASTQWDDGTGLPGGDPQDLNTTEDSRTTCTLFTEDGGTTVGASAGGGSGGGGGSGHWELLVDPGSPPDPYYADGDFLYVLVP